MSSTGNQYFSKVENTVLAPSALHSQSVVGSLSSLKQVTGTCVPTAIGDYAVLDDHGEPLTVPAYSPVFAVHLSSDVPLTSAGAATVTCGLTATQGAVIVAPNFLPAPAPFTSVNQGVVAPSGIVGAPYVAAANQFVTAEVAAFPITGGVLRVTLLTF